MIKSLKKHPFLVGVLVILTTPLWIPLVFLFVLYMLAAEVGRQVIQWLEEREQERLNRAQP